MCILDGRSSKQIVGILSGSIEGVFNDLLGSVQKKWLQVLAPLLSKACSAPFDTVDGVDQDPSKETIAGAKTRG